MHDLAGCAWSSHNFFIISERQIKIIFRNKAVGNQKFQGIQIGLHIALGVRAAAAPKDPILIHMGGKRRVFPHRMISLRHHILMGGHEKRKLI